MAQPTVTPAAMQRARDLAAQCDSDRPIVSVTWHPATHNNVRGAGGETIWAQTEGNWVVFVGDLRFMDETKFHPTKIDDLEFLFVGTDASVRLQELTIDYVEGQFVVR